MQLFRILETAEGRGEGDRSERTGGEGGKEHSLLGINLKAHSDILGRILHILIHASRAETILNALILGPLITRMALPVLDLQMHRLVLLVVRARPAHAR